MPITPRCSLIVLVLGAVAGCGVTAAEQNSSCGEYEVETCRTDRSCGSPDPCSFECARVSPPQSEQALQLCVDALKAIALPDPLAQPMQHAMACSARSMKEIDCLFLFFPK